MQYYAGICGKVKILKRSIKYSLLILSCSVKTDFYLIFLVSEFENFQCILDLEKVIYIFCEQAIDMSSTVRRRSDTIQVFMNLDTTNNFSSPFYDLCRKPTTSARRLFQRLCIMFGIDI